LITGKLEGKSIRWGTTSRTKPSSLRALTLIGWFWRQKSDFVGGVLDLREKLELNWNNENLWDSTDNKWSSSSSYWDPLIELLEYFERSLPLISTHFIVQTERLKREIFLRAFISVRGAWLGADDFTGVSITCHVYTFYWFARIFNTFSFTFVFLWLARLRIFGVNV
jgi:hypothetical protein